MPIIAAMWTTPKLIQMKDQWPEMLTLFLCLHMLPDLFNISSIPVFYIQFPTTACFWFELKQMPLLLSMIRLSSIFNFIFSQADWNNCQLIVTFMHPFNTRHTSVANVFGWMVLAPVWTKYLDASLNYNPTYNYFWLSLFWLTILTIFWQHHLT